MAQFLGPPIGRGGYQPPPHFLGPPVQQAPPTFNREPGLAIAALLSHLGEGYPSPMIPAQPPAVDPAIAAAMGSRFTDHVGPINLPAAPPSIASIAHQIQQRHAVLALLQQMGAGWNSIPGRHPYVPPTY